LNRAALKRTAWCASLAALLAAAPAHAAELSYGGRLVDDSGTPLAGPVAITLRFFGSATGIDQLGPAKTFPSVELSGGVFQLAISLDDAEQAAILGNGSDSVFVQVETQGTVYPRQRFAAVPFALRVPIDNSTLVFGADSQLAVGEIPMSQVTGLEAELAQKLGSSLTSSTVTAKSFTTAGQDGVVIKPYGSQAGETGELRFEEKTGSHHVGFKAPDAVAADQVWTLPAADGASGEVLSTDGASASLKQRASTPYLHSW
jgi:hypothetical protein